MTSKSNIPDALVFLKHYTLSTTIFSAYKIGVFDIFFDNPENAILDIENFIQAKKLDERMAKGIVSYLSLRNVFEEVEIEKKYKLDELGFHLIKENWISYIIYFIGGYGNIVHNSDELANKGMFYDTDIVRQIDWVTKGTELMSLTEHHKSYSRVLDLVKKRQSNKVLDIGCGTGNFLLKLANAAECKLGVGIDISAEACSLARKNILSNKLNLKIEEGDFIDTTNRLKENYESFDIITAMMIIHEYLYHGDEKVINTLKSISNLLSENGTFILLDKASDILPEAPLYFTEYKFVHDLTLQNLCNVAKWRDLIRKSGMEVITEEFLPKHTGSILFECKRI